VKTNRRRMAAMAATLLALAGLTNDAHAAVHIHTGRIRTIRVENSTTINDGFTMVGLTAAPNCANLETEFQVGIKLPARTTEEYKAMWSILLAAKLAEKEVTVHFSNTILTNGRCTIVSLRLQP